MREYQGKMVEGRGTWAYQTGILTRQRAEEYLDPMVECNMNFIIYPPDETSVPNLLPVAHEAGLEFHLMLGMVDVPDKTGGPHPWRQVSSHGGGGSSACPSHKELRQQSIEKMVSFVKQFPDVDGVHLDGIWLDSDTYHGPVWLMYCYCEECRKGFKKDHGVDPLEIAMDSKKDPALTEAWKRWRCELLNGYAREVRDALKRINPRYILSATAHMSMGAPSIFTEPYICSPNFQEWGRWLTEGIMEVFFPMPYTVDNAAWKEHLKFCRQAEQKTGDKGFTYPGVGVSYLAKPEQIVEQIKIARRAGVGGVTLFPWGPVIERSFLKHLKKIWKEPAVLPHRTKE